MNNGEASVGKLGKNEADKVRWMGFSQLWESGKLRFYSLIVSLSLLLELPYAIALNSILKKQFYESLTHRRNHVSHFQTNLEPMIWAATCEGYNDNGIGKRVVEVLQYELLLDGFSNSVLSWPLMTHRRIIKFGSISKLVLGFMT